MLSGARAAISSLKHSDPAIVIARSTTTHSSGTGHTLQPASKKNDDLPIQPTPNNLSGNVPSAPQKTFPKRSHSIPSAKIGNHHPHRQPVRIDLAFRRDLPKLAS